METNAVIFLTVILIPLTMIGFGLYFMKIGPKRINHIFGYRTSRSMKNQDTWQFAHKHCGRIWFLWGLILLAFSLAVVIYSRAAKSPLFESDDTIFIIQLIVLILSILPTEIALRKNFDKYGNRKYPRV